MRINEDDEGCPILDLNFEHVPADVELWITNEDKENIAIIGLEELLKHELNGNGNADGNFVATAAEMDRWRRSAEIFERMAAMINTALLSVHEREEKHD